MPPTEDAPDRPFEWTISDWAKAYRLFDLLGQSPNTPVFFADVIAGISRDEFEARYRLWKDVRTDDAPELAVDGMEKDDDTGIPRPRLKEKGREVDRYDEGGDDRTETEEFRVGVSEGTRKNLPRYYSSLEVIDSHEEGFSLTPIGEELRDPFERIHGIAELIENVRPILRLFPAWHVFVTDIEVLEEFPDLDTRRAPSAASEHVEAGTDEVDPISVENDGLVEQANEDGEFPIAGDGEPGEVFLYRGLFTRDAANLHQDAAERYAEAIEGTGALREILAFDDHYAFGDAGIAERESAELVVDGGSLEAGYVDPDLLGELEKAGADVGVYGGGAFEELEAAGSDNVPFTMSVGEGTVVLRVWGDEDVDVESVIVVSESPVVYEWAESLFEEVHTRATDWSATDG